MPNRTIYVRKEDIEIFDSIKDKPRFIHAVLHGGTINQAFVVNETKRATTTMPITGMIFRNDSGSTRKEQLCEHYQPKGQCLTKGCKYGKGKK